jgi:hypothetical protein
MRAACGEARHDYVATFTRWQLFIQSELQAGERSEEGSHPIGVTLEVTRSRGAADYLNGHLRCERLSKGRRATVQGIPPLSQAREIVVGGHSRLLLKCSRPHQLYAGGLRHVRVYPRQFDPSVTHVFHRAALLAPRQQPLAAHPHAALARLARVID